MDLEVTEEERLGTAKNVREAVVEMFHKRCILPVTLIRINSVQTLLGYITLTI